MLSRPLVSVPELAAAISAGPSVAPLLLDVRWALGANDGYDSYLLGHLPGAIFVDLERDLSGEAREGACGRHPMPSVDDFELDMAECGVDNHRPVVIYDDNGGISAARAWWMLRHFGKRDVSVLDGGLTAWKAHRMPIESGFRLVEEGDFEVRRGRTRVLDATGAQQYAEEGVLLDGRPADRFRGEHDDVDPVAGHIPGAVNIPARSLNAPDGTMLPADQLREIFVRAGVDGERPVATYCGSGGQAAYLALALNAAGIGEDVPVYVGSWSDWVSDPSRPVATSTPVDATQA